MASAYSLESLQPRAEAILGRYVDPAQQYAFGTYDNLYGEDGPLTPADVLLANLLSLRLGWRDVIPLFALGQGAPQTLRERLDGALTGLKDAKAFEDHETLDDLEEALQSLRAANLATEAVTGWTPVTVSKVLHRRRPHIVPLLDSRIRAFYRVRHPQAIRTALWEDIQSNREWLARLGAKVQTPDGRPISLLRVADIIVWGSTES